MDFNSIKYKANYYVLLVLVFVIPLERKLIAPVTILFLLTSLANYKLDWKLKKGVLLFGGIFLFYLVGLLYSTNTAAGAKDLTTKLPLILLPIGIFLANLEFRKILPNILKSFIEGCLISTIIAVIFSGIQFFYTTNISNFFYGEVALFAHPSYLAMLLSLAIVVLYYFIFEANENKTIKPVYAIALLSIFSLYILMLASKTGLLAMLFCHTIAIGYWMVKSRKYGLGIITVVGIVVLFALVYKSSNTFQSRINELVSLNETETLDVNTSTAARGIIWKISLEVILNQPLFGYGTGDTKQVLIENYVKNGQDFLAKKQLNAHNQFLQTAIGIGIFGSIVLLGLLLFPLIIALKQKHYLYFFFLCIVLLNFFTESMLERQVGVTFYALFNALFYAAYISNESKKLA